MLKQTTRGAGILRPWICASCLQKLIRKSRRGFAALAVAPAQLRQTTPNRTDDDNLRRLFDSEPFWKEFSSQRRDVGHKGSRRATGLLHNKYLTNPQGFLVFAGESLEKCKALVDKLVGASSIEDYKTFARDFDRLSDLLCRVIDSVEFIRNVHPDQRIQQAATQAHAAMYEYMNVLNTHKELYMQLQKAASTPEVRASWNEEEKTTTDVLIKDFKQSAIGESEAVRRRFVELSNDIVQAGSDMLDRMAPKTESVSFPSSQMKGMDPVAVKKLTRWGITTIPTSGRYASLAMRTVEDPEVRRGLYIACRSSSKGSIERVETLLEKRAELARVCGHDSFAHMTLGDKMAKTPQAVNQFLKALAENNKTNAHRDLAELLDLKHGDARHEYSSMDHGIDAWDRSYYTRRLRSLLYSHTMHRPPEVLSSYFSLGTVMQGLSRLFSRLYGVHLVPRETGAGETWNDDVRRLDVLDENEGHIAVLYCDLFARPNKTPNPAHFTLRCSREISKSEIDAVAHLVPANPSLEDLSDALNDGMALARDRNTGSLHQLPTIAFICDFARPKLGSTQPTLLTFPQVSTLFHEMGHALHSILGRTALQNVAGTRCATDFAELPSILMEYFAASPQVLGLYARHWQTDEPLNVDLVTDELAATKRLQAAHETETQILFSVLDQRLHSTGVVEERGRDPRTPGWSTGVYHDVYNDGQFSTTPEPRGTSWQGFFGHLYGYGAVYYSYLFDRAIAGKVWAHVFRDDPLARDRGQHYRDEVLRWGGGRDPWRCVGGVLGRRYDWLGESGGGEAAMKEVGRWGVGEAGEAGSPM